jgi:hypothetical protein
MRANSVSQIFDIRYLILDLRNAIDRRYLIMDTRYS